MVIFKLSSAIKAKLRHLETSSFFIGGQEFLHRSHFISFFKMSILISCIWHFHPAFWKLSFRLTLEEKRGAFFEDFFKIKHSAFVMALSYIYGIYEYVRKLIKRMRAQKQTVTRMSFLKKHLRARISVYMKSALPWKTFLIRIFIPRVQSASIRVVVHKSYCWN